MLCYSNRTDNDRDGDGNEEKMCGNGDSVWGWGCHSLQPSSPYEANQTYTLWSCCTISDEYLGGVHHSSTEGPCTDK